MKKPNLFIVGEPKFGSTSMYYYLDQHPEMFMFKPKEPRYFCKDMIGESKGRWDVNSYLLDLEV